MTMFVGPSQLPAVKKFLSKSFSKKKKVPAYITYLSQRWKREAYINTEHWVSYTVKNFQQKTVRAVVAEITGYPIERIIVEYGIGPLGQGDVIRIWIT